MSQFTVSGRFRSRKTWKPFTKSVEAINENVASEYVLSRFGSEHGLKRPHVEIEEVTAA
ncbi:large subunit ribosomal protein LX [Halogranum gelatinilyticum]|uniref:Large ribosomal subunit protein eL20 n=1 Tax=Halogranum gelatinilyticum TaxID=660521 RepID=A0A1G9P730_9EURY|nr:50S ribosomal protein L18Ae [Halogranum gelatinilyticum]SDL93965.1 large subunit ribosomal protein LX [Halogranum gelatinilyticum]